MEATFVAAGATLLLRLRAHSPAFSALTLVKTTIHVGHLLTATTNVSYIPLLIRAINMSVSAANKVG